MKYLIFIAIILTQNLFAADKVYQKLDRVEFFDLSFVLPEKSILKEESQNYKKIIPYESDNWLLIIRKIELNNKDLDLNFLIKSGLTQDIKKEAENKKISTYKRDKLINGNSVRIIFYHLQINDNHYTAWLTYKKDIRELEEHFRSFLIE